MAVGPECAVLVGVGQRQDSSQRKAVGEDQRVLGVYEIDVCCGRAEGECGVDRAESDVHPLPCFVCVSSYLLVVDVAEESAGGCGVGGRSVPLHC